MASEGLGSKASFPSPSPPARSNRLRHQQQLAPVIFNHMITRGLLSLKQFNWELWPAYSRDAGGDVSWNTPVVAGGQGLVPGASPFSGVLQASRASLAPSGR